MIQLYHDSRVYSSLRPPQRGIRRLVYKNIADIPRILANPHAVISNLRAEAPAFVPKPRTLPLEEEEAEAEAEAENDAEEPEVDNTEIINSTQADALPTIKNLPDDTAVFTDEQKQSAITLQRWYRKLMKKRYVIPKNNTDAARHRQFEKCLEESHKIQWTVQSHYRFLFLGPLPHVLVCLEAAHAWAMTTKKSNKRRFKRALHQDLEDIQKRLTDQKYVFC